MSQKNGHKYVVVWLKILNLCLKKARIEGEESLGILRFSEKIPYNPELLSNILREDLDLVSSAMRVFERADLLNIESDETIYIEAIARLTGKESDSAERVRRHRIAKNENIKLLQCNKNVTLQNDIIEEEKEEEKEEELFKKKAGDALNLWNKSISPKIPSLQKLSSERKKKFLSRLAEGMVLADVISKINASSFLTGLNDRKWTADFDWVVANSTNWVKVMEGKYDDKKIDSKPVIISSYIDELNKNSVDPLSPDDLQVLVKKAQAKWGHSGYIATLKNRARDEDGHIRKIYSMQTIGEGL
jgi:hypothetical protein